MREPSALSLNEGVVVHLSIYLPIYYMNIYTYMYTHVHI